MNKVDLQQFGSVQEWQVLMNLSDSYNTSESNDHQATLSSFKVDCANDVTNSLDFSVGTQNVQSSQPHHHSSDQQQTNMGHPLSPVHQVHERLHHQDLGCQRMHQQMNQVLSNSLSQQDHIQPSYATQGLHDFTLSSGRGQVSNGYHLEQAHPGFSDQQSTMNQISNTVPAHIKQPYQSQLMGPPPARNNVSWGNESSVGDRGPTYNSYGGPTPSLDPAAASTLYRPIHVKMSGNRSREGLYSSTGFDMVGVLARVVARPDPQIAIGPIDTGCSFLVVDARKHDFPIVYASQTFSKLTGYSNQEILGQNCRFLQSPDGLVKAGEKRVYTDGNAVYHLKKHIAMGKETQASLINYTKAGKPFINLVTCIPITWDSDEIAYYVGFQVDLIDQPSAILNKMKNGSYAVNYSLINTMLPRPLSVGSAPEQTAKAITSSLVSESGVVDLVHQQPQTTGHGTENSSCATLMSQLQTSQKVESSHISSIDTKQVGSSAERAMDDTQFGSDVIGPAKEDIAGVVINMIAKNGVNALVNDGYKKQFSRLLLDNCDDFVHVLSLKGSLLYVSPSASKILEYEPGELCGRSLASFCHPSDIVSVLRDLKESGSVSHPTVTLMYRIRRKYSGYMWLEANGKLYMEHGKGRKCVILIGRPREVYKMSRQALENAGGCRTKEYWSKLSLDGMYLYSTPSVKDILGYTPEDMIGTPFTELVASEDDVAKVKEALNSAASGEAIAIRHHLKGKNGLVDVISHLYSSQAAEDEVNLPPASNAIPRRSKQKCICLILQTSIYSSECSQKPPVKALNSFKAATASSVGSFGCSESPIALALPTYSSTTCSEGDSLPGSSGGTSFSAVLSTFKSLSQALPTSDNVFDELDTTRGTSWQYEIHKLRLTNKKLREEKDTLISLQRKRRKRSAALKDASLAGEVGACDTHGAVQSGSSSSGASVGSSSSVRSCANCGRQGSTEWRTGPTGSKTLCNACGLRWAKARGTSSSPSVHSAHSGSGGSSSPDSPLATPPFSPMYTSRPEIRSQSATPSSSSWSDLDLDYSGGGSRRGSIKSGLPSPALNFAAWESNNSNIPTKKIKLEHRSDTGMMVIPFSTMAFV